MIQHYYHLYQTLEQYWSNKRPYPIITMENSSSVSKLDNHGWPLILLDSEFLADRYVNTVPSLSHEVLEFYTCDDVTKIENRRMNSIYHIRLTTMIAKCQFPGISKFVNAKSQYQSISNVPSIPVHGKIDSTAKLIPFFSPFGPLK